MNVALLSCLFVCLISKVVGLCPPNNNLSANGSCVYDCADDNGCSNGHVCCKVGCSRLCINSTSCSSIECQNVTCSIPLLTTYTAVQGECCQACVNSSKLCPNNFPPDTNDSCSIECYNDSQCAINDVCCGNGCGQLCTDRRCQLVDCPTINCIPPSISVTTKGECCPSCAVDYCTTQCIGNGPPVDPIIACNNGTVINTTITHSGCDLQMECYYSNITDALQCVAETNSTMTITSLIINQPADETLQTATLANIDLPFLQSLSIINGSLKYIEDGAFNVSGFMSLTDLNLSGNVLAELTSADFMGLDGLINLDLGNNGVQRLNVDLRPLFMSLQSVNLVGSNFICDCCLEWLVQCDYSAVMLGSEYCDNSQVFRGNMSIAEMTAEDICPTCRNGTFRYSDTCSRSCVSSRLISGTDNYYDLAFWGIIAIGVAVGIVIAMPVNLLLCMCYRCCCRKKRRNQQSTDHEMFKVADAAGSYGDVSKGKFLGFANRFTLRFTRKETDAENTHGIGKAKSKKKSRKEPIEIHENIYDVDEVDTKFETFYSEEVMLEELLPYITQLSIIWYELGQRLGLDTANLDTVKYAIGTVEGRCQKMLEMWMSSEGPHNWETFLNALKSGQSRSNTEHQVADDIYNVRSIKILMESVYSAAQNKEEDVIVWEAWNFFLSKAEGSASYCNIFFRVKGLDLLLYCNQLFTSDWQLRAVFFYILDAITQYPELQSYLMRSDVMYACKAALASKYQPIISFTAGSVVVRMAIEGDEPWGYLIPDREEMLNSLSKAIPRWDIQHKKQDDFARGLQKLDYLVRAAVCEDERIAYWGIWALANHCITNGGTYCVQLRRTGQLAQIEQLMQDAGTIPIKQLCTQVINCCEEYS